MDHLPEDFQPLIPPQSQPSYKFGEGNGKQSQKGMLGGRLLSWRHVYTAVHAVPFFSLSNWETAANEMHDHARDWSERGRQSRGEWGRGKRICTAVPLGRSSLSQLLWTRNEGDYVQFTPRTNVWTTWNTILLWTLCAYYVNLYVFVHVGELVSVCTVDLLTLEPNPGYYQLSTTSFADSCFPWRQNVSRTGTAPGGNHDFCLASPCHQ